MPRSRGNLEGSSKTAQTIEQGHSENSPEVRQTSWRKSKRGDASRIKPWKWEPGQSGNPGGRPKGIVSTALRKQLLKAAKGGKRDLEAIVEAILKTAKKGDAKAFCAIRDTVDGPPKQESQAHRPPILVQFIRDPRTPPVVIATKPALPALKE